MATLRLTMALDHKAKRGDTEHGRYSYRCDGRWFLVKYGPKYRNIYEVTDFSSEEEAVLLKLERPQEE